MSTPPAGPVRPDVVLRELGPEEYDVLDAVFDGLSPTSRLRRFFGPVPRLTPGVRRALAAVDGERHLAVAAFAGDDPIGIARLVGEGAGRAELAVEVVDRWQGQGVGTRLVRAVLARGRDLGVVTVVADVLAENVAIQRLLHSVLPGLSGHPDGAEITFLADLTVPTSSPAVPRAA